MRSVKLKRSHGDIYLYLELCKQKRRAKQRDDELEFSRVPYSDLLVTVIKAGGGGGWRGTWHKYSLGSVIEIHYTTKISWPNS